MEDTRIYQNGIWLTIICLLYKVYLVIYDRLYLIINDRYYLVINDRYYLVIDDRYYLVINDRLYLVTGGEKKKDNKNLQQKVVIKVSFRL